MAAANRARPHARAAHRRPRTAARRLKPVAENAAHRLQLARPPRARRHVSLRPHGGLHGRPRRVVRRAGRRERRDIAVPRGAPLPIPGRPHPEHRSGVRCPSGPSRSSSRRPPRRWYRTARAPSSGSSTSRRRRSPFPFWLSIFGPFYALLALRDVFFLGPLHPILHSHRWWSLHKVHHARSLRSLRSPCTPSTSTCPT